MSICAVRRIGKNRGSSGGIESYFVCCGTKAPKVSDSTAKVVSSGSALLAKAMLCPKNGTVERFCVEPGQRSFSNAWTTSLGTMDAGTLGLGSS